MTAARHLLLLDGWQHRRGPGHWQGLLAEQLADEGWTVEYLTLPAPDAPRRAAWTAAVRRELRRTPGCVVAAHGLGALLWLRLAEERAGPDVPPAARVLLVAPPAPDRAAGDLGGPLLAGPAAVRTLSAAPPLLVHAADDPWAPQGADTCYARPLGLPVVTLDGGGHLNERSGYGPWPAAARWVRSGVWPAAPDPVAVPAVPDPVAVPGPAAAAEPPPQPVRVDGPQALLEAVRAAHRPAGHRLGILLAADLDPAVEAEVARLMTRHGQSPLRRLARPRPRPGERRVRADDLVDFLRRYGHEYTVAVADEPEKPKKRDALLSAARDEGCILLMV
ncbi:alpha/beta hydrolase [Streptomyces sp. NPDC047000]|uniref:RBBP9/YdeN family alpha/beta hydrolase n=1 Tax=Streptomyces sp. NPDC047000 TaxID=3155474 RepID=UPI0034081B4B